MNLSTTVINGTGIEEDMNAIEIQISDIDLWICFAVSLLGLVILFGCTGTFSNSGRRILIIENYVKHISYC